MAAGGTSAIVRRLRTRLIAPPRRSLAVAESLTCGRLQAAIGEVSGASDFFLGGMTAYAIEEKVRHLGVDRVEAERCDAVSASIASQMAVGACRMFGSDLSIATTGFAEPNPERGFAAPSAFVAIARHAGDRIDVVHECFLERPRFSRTAMQMEVTREALIALEEVLRRIAPS